MPKKLNTSASATDLRRRAEAELKVLGANRQRRLMMALVSRAVATQLRDRRAKPVLSNPATDTQRLVEKSLEIVHRVARELRPSKVRARSRSETS